MNIIFEKAEIAAARITFVNATRSLAGALGLDVPETGTEFELADYAARFDPKYVRLIDADNVIEIWISPEVTLGFVNACGAYYADIAEFIKAVMPLIKLGKSLLARAAERFEAVVALAVSKLGPDSAA